LKNVYSEDEDIKKSKYKILGDAYCGLGKYDKAIGWYNELPVKSKEMNDELLEYKYAFGKVLLLDGNKKRAFTYLSQVYDYKADYKDIKHLMEQK